MRERGSCFRPRASYALEGVREGGSEVGRERKRGSEGGSE